MHIMYILNGHFASYDADTNCSVNVKAFQRVAYSDYYLQQLYVLHDFNANYNVILLN